MKPRVTDWVGAIKNLLLPPGASLTVHWHIARDLWDALMANITLNYREVRLIRGVQERVVVFEAITADISAKMPTYECLHKHFSSGQLHLLE